MSRALKYLSMKLYGFFHPFVAAIPYFLEYRKFCKSAEEQNDERFELSLKNAYPCLNDKTSDTPFDYHYVYHTGWAARILRKIDPKEHIDISSSLYFVSIASAFVKTKFYDYRPADLILSNLESGAADIMSLPFEDDSLESISCLHVMEHIGLGRYGDPINASADLKAISELKRVVKPGGSLIFATPIGGKARVMYNAHRIYTYELLEKLFDGFEIVEFALVSDHPKAYRFLETAAKEDADACNYGCGCFWFRKKA